MGVILVILLFLAMLALSWGIVVGLVWAICMLLGFGFSIPTATAIWLVMILLRGIFYQGGKD